MPMPSARMASRIVPLPDASTPIRTGATVPARPRRAERRTVRSQLGGAMITAGDLKLDALPLLGALMEPEVDDIVFLEGAVTAIEQRAATGIPATVTPDERGLGWMRLVDDLAGLYAPRPYIGMFRRTIRAAAETAATLPQADRRIAAMVIIDQTTATAESLSDFRDGVLAAESVAPTILHPRLIVGRLLRTALCYVDDERARVNAGYALRLTVEVLTKADEQSLSLDDLEILASAIDEAPADVDDLRALGEQLHRKDRKAFLSLLPADEHARHRRRR